MLTCGIAVDGCLSKHVHACRRTWWRCVGVTLFFPKNGSQDVKFVFIACGIVKEACASVRTVSHRLCYATQSIMLMESSLRPNHKVKVTLGATSTGG